MFGHVCLRLSVAKSCKSSFGQPHASDARSCAAQLRLTPAQNDAKHAAEEDIKGIQEELASEEDAAKKAELSSELTKKQSALEELLDGFEVRSAHTSSSNT